MPSYTREYEECFTQLRFYDERQMGLVNFVLTLSSTAATLVFGFYKIFEKDISKFLLAQNIPISNYLHKHNSHYSWNDSK